MLCQSVSVSNALNGTTATSAAQATTFTLNAINVQPNPKVTSVSAAQTALSSASFSTSQYTVQINFALQSASVAQITFQLQMSSAYAGYTTIPAVLLSYTVVPDPNADPDIIAETSYPTNHTQQAASCPALSRSPTSCRALTT